MTRDKGRWRGHHRLLSISLGMSMLLPTTFWNPPFLSASADSALKKNPEVEIGGVQVIPSQNHHPFPWDKPGLSSPVLRWGAPKAAGMKVGPLNAIDSHIQQAIRERTTPGAVVLIARRGIVVKHKAYGHSLLYRDDRYTPVEKPIAMREDTIFDIASISKLFTVTAAMKLYEQGKFKLDDPVARYIPEFAEEGKEKVTIRQLMTHTSGLAPWIPLYQMGDSREERLQIVFRQPLEAEPGTRYAYSDLNLITLGALVERLSGMSLDHFVKKHITDPLGMTDTMYNPPASLKPRIAATEYQAATGRGLVWGEVHDENAWSLGGVAGHAGVFSTARDLAVFGHMFLQKGKYGGKRILKESTVELMAKNHLPDFPGDDQGLGWELNQGWYMDALADEKTMGHTGFTGTSLVLNRKNQTVAILLTNRVHPNRNPTVNPLRRQVARLAADAIPVGGLGKKGAWFSGYGDNLDRSLRSGELPESSKPSTLSFDTWYRVEAEPGTGEDSGTVEASADGTRWKPLAEPFVGNSDGWKRVKVTVPPKTKYLRFRYKTDDYANGRGWYVKNPELKTAGGKKVDVQWSGDGWEIRNW